MIDQRKLEEALNKGLRTCGELLVNEAKKNLTTQGIVSEDGGVELRNSLNYRIEDNDTLIVGTNIFYAIWKEFGTGANHSKYPEKARQGWWVYVDNPMALADYTPSTQSVKTEQEAKETCAWLRAQGLQAFYTDGEDPRPYLQPALDNNKDKITQIVTDALLEVLKND